jgi:hypothetical protein
VLTSSRPTARKSRWPRVLIALGVLVALLVAADRVALVLAERAAAKTIKTSQHLEHTPSVSVAGFPFLTQLVTGHFGKVTLAASDVTVGREGRTVRMSRVTADLHGVKVARDLSSVRSDRASATATVTYADLSAALVVPLTYGGPSPDGVGRITAHKTVTVAVQQLRGTATAEIKIENGALRFLSPKVGVAGAGSAAVPQPVLDLLASSFGDPLALTHLPFGLQVRSVTADSRGVHVTLTAKNVTFRHS